jgi:hypothetical protein
MTRHSAKYDAIPVALPRRWVKDWMLNIWHLAFGHSLGVVQPFRWILFRELSTRERMVLMDKQ